jgi:predicted nucleic acid-binding protein
LGTLTLPVDGPVYADAQVVIYSVEKHPEYAPILRPLWETVASGALEVVTSELTIMEVLIGAFKRGDTSLEHHYETFLACPGIRLCAITPDILRAAGRLRATSSSLRTPDAIHAATAHSCQCTLLLTNDRAFRRVPDLSVIFLDNVMGP